MYGEADEKRTRDAWNKAMTMTWAIGGTTLLLVIAGLIARIRWLSIGALALGGCAVYAWVSLKVKPWSAYLKFLGDMKAGLTRETEGAFVSLSEASRAVDGVEVHDMLLDAGGDAHLLFYWDDEKPRPDFAPGAHLKVTSFGKFVTSCEQIARRKPEGG